MENTNNRKKRSRQKPSDALRRAVLHSGRTLYRVSKDSGVPYATLHRFVARKRPVSMAALDQLCTYLGLTLTLQVREEGE
jgi:hypothetical protein